MKYKIFKLRGKEITRDNFYFIEHITTYKLEEVDELASDGFMNIEEAVEYIRSQSNTLKSSILTILPIIKIDYDGKIVGSK